MKKIKFILLFLLIFINGCGNKREVSIILNSSNKGEFKWEYKYDQANIISEIRSKRVENCNEKNMCEYKWSFKTKSSGEVVLTFQNIKNKDNIEELKNEINYIFKVDKDKKIKLIKTFGTTVKNQKVQIN